MGLRHFVALVVESGLLLGAVRSTEAQRSNDFAVAGS
jgi:hypothetical protein